MTTSNISALIRHRQYEGKGCKGNYSSSLKECTPTSMSDPEDGCHHGYTKAVSGGKTRAEAGPGRILGRSAGLPGKPYALVVATQEDPLLGTIRGALDL
jgi:hypothetical protein